MKKSRQLARERCNVTYFQNVGLGFVEIFVKNHEEIALDFTDGPIGFAASKKFRRLDGLNKRLHFRGCEQSSQTAIEKIEIE
jgi:hypothetical protein